MKIATDKLIAQLSGEVIRQQERIAYLQNLNDDKLNWREQTDSWSVLECVEHLKRYNDFYIPEIEKRINAAPTTPNPIFSSGWLGNYFANSMLPKEKPNKMKAFKEMNPINSNLNRSLLLTFDQQLQKMNGLLDKSQQVDLSKVKTSISISTVLKLRLGDTFRFVINHQTRHFAQIERVLTAMPSK